MEAYYTGVPLLLITADRPRRFRGTGAPQTAEQENLMGVYASFSQDLEGDEVCRIHQWDWSGPCHLNICIEEPRSYRVEYEDMSSLIPQELMVMPIIPAEPVLLNQFFQKSKKPLIIVSALDKKNKKAVTEFLLKLNAPIYCESGSSLREDPNLEQLQIRVEPAVWKLSKSGDYEIDGVLRIGGVPVTRLWRDLEDRPHQLAQCSISEVPFSGLSWGRHIQCRLSEFLPSFDIPQGWKCEDFSNWREKDQELQGAVDELYQRFPTSELSLYRDLSRKIQNNSMLYLGNSLPIREWDWTAVFEPKGIEVEASRGLNGIDGQLSTFLGLCSGERENWTILGDLTMLYDFPALWILQQMKDIPIKVVVINNRGGKLFARLYKDPVFQHIHDFDFEHFAKSWKIPYFLLDKTVESPPLPKQAFIEINPDLKATEDFWKEYNALMQK